MAKFINKKEQVFDLKLTSYGHYLFSIGNFTPTYYAFFDDNIAYDREYFVSASTEPQNHINTRIKEETQYLESFVLFEDVNNIPGGFGSPAGISQRTADGDFFKIDITPTKIIPRKDIFNNDLAIGDAHLDGATQKAPAWKVVALQGKINSSTTHYVPELVTGSCVQDDCERDTEPIVSMIPQINLELNYVKRAIPQEAIAAESLGPTSIRQAQRISRVFRDGRVIELESNDALLYVEEINTQLLTENYDVEVYLVTSSKTPEQQLIGNFGADVLMRKYFQKEIPQVVDGFMKSESPIENSQQNITTASVEYYFDLLADSQIEQDLACKGAQVFNKQSYYVDIDFDCEKSADDDIYYDIYGKATEPEICD